MKNTIQARQSTKSLNSKQTQKDLGYYNNKLATLPTAKVSNSVNGAKRFLGDRREPVAMLNLRQLDKLDRLDKLGVDSFQRRLKTNPSISFDIDKPSTIRSLTLQPTSQQIGGYQAYSSNLVRENNAKKEIQDYKEKKKLEASIRRWKRKVDETAGSSNKKEEKIEVEEEEEEFVYDDNPDVSSLTMHGSTSHMRLFNKTFATVQASKYDPEKEKQLAKLVRSRLKKGYTVAQMAMDPVFENVLDVCCDKSFFSSIDKSDKEITLDDWRALRKCKYLRVSQRNIASLKEATLETLREK